MFRSLSTPRVWLLIAVIVLTAAACAPSSAPAVPGAVIKIEQPAAAQVNDTVKVAITAADVPALIAFEAHLSFDPNMLAVVQVLDGNFVQADFRVQNAYDNIAGTVDYAIAQIDRDPARGSGILFEVVFRVKATGDSPISFRATEATPAGILLSDPNGAALQVALLNGGISVK